MSLCNKENSAKNDKKIGIIGYWFATNYGGVASYYSLYQKISEMGYFPYLIENPYFSVDKEGADVFSRNFFIDHNVRIAQPYDNQNLEKLNDLGDTFLLGSDQVLTTSSIRAFGKLFLMEFALDPKKRIAYSASCGGDNLDGKPELIAYAKEQLKKFSAISVREYSATEILKNKFGVIAETMIDPIFFLSAKDYRKLEAKSLFNRNKDYVLAYILDPTDDKKNVIEMVSETLGLPIEIALDGRKFTHNTNLNKMGMPNETLPELNEGEWINRISNASYIVTDSFHGAAMALIMNKPFIMYANHDRGYPRFVTLAKMFNVKERLIENSQQLSRELINKEIDFDAINKRIEQETRKASDWIEFSLKYNKSAQSVDAFLDMKKQCTGCCACYNICPTNAIEMKENEEGFLNPTIDKSKCINCGLCAKKCVALNPNYLNETTPQCYAAIANDEIREVSSSGGAFSIAAEWILNHKGIVCGAAFDDEFNVKHIMVANKEELDLLRGSKYYQSNVGLIYRDIKNALNKDKYVLFTGMPCQVAALKSFLGKEYPKLITIDILCHGISSHKVFKKYWNDILGGKKIEDLKFKSKKPWGWHAGVNARFTDGTVYSKIIEDDLYYVAYIQGLSKNTPCGTCLFNRLPRQGDLTIGDFWKIQDFDKSLNDNKGTSVVLVNNTRGKAFFNDISKNFNVLKEVPLEYAIAGNGIIKYPYRLNDHRDEFFANLERVDFSCLVNQYRKRDIDSMATKFSADVGEYFYLANIVAKNKGGRKVLFWGDNSIFRSILSKHFGIEVSLAFSTDQGVLKTSEFFDRINQRSSEFYIVVLGKAFDNSDYKRFCANGYTAIKDFVYRMINPIVLENYDMSKGYEDIFGNRISKTIGNIKRVTFRGYNNKITIENDVRNLNNLIIDVTANTKVYIAQYSNFTQPHTRIETKGYDGAAELKIGKGCIFMDTLCRLFLHRQKTMVLINDGTTFGERMSIRANQGKRIIIGKDCMFSSNIELWAGDGHTIMDVNTQKPLNLYPSNPTNEKNLIVLGDHVWIGFRSFIMAGTNIGNGSIVGAQSVVKGVFPNNCTIAGSPAKIIRNDVAWCRDMIATDIKKCGQYAHKTSDAKAPISGKNVLIIGGTLFMGVQLVNSLLSRGNNVTIATRGKHSDSFGDNVNRVILDISKPQTVAASLKGKHYDVVFHNLAYCSNYVRNLLSNVTCDRYIQLSSFEVYTDQHMDLKEEDFDSKKMPLEWNEMSAGYIKGKQQAECAVLQEYKNISGVVIRIPYVTKTERLYYYCNCIVQGIAMNIDDINRCLTFVRDSDVGEFLPWIAAQNFTGAINFSAMGYVSIKDILSYIEKKTGRKALIDIKNGMESPFHVFDEKSFSCNLDKVKQLGFEPVQLDSWFWSLMDEYIERALKSAIRKE